jgi:hypothetical protein
VVYEPACDPEEKSSQKTLVPLHSDVPVLPLPPAVLDPALEAERFDEERPEVVRAPAVCADEETAVVDPIPDDALIEEELAVPPFPSEELVDDDAMVDATPDEAFAEVDPEV